MSDPAAPLPTDPTAAAPTADPTAPAAPTTAPTAPAVDAPAAADKPPTAADVRKEFQTLLDDYINVVPMQFAQRYEALLDKYAPKE